MKYIENNSHNSYFNLALEEFVFTHLKDDDYILLWQNENTIVVGKNQNTAEEINRAAVRELGVNVVRRVTGGGAVYHDMGNLNFSYITDWRIEYGVSYERFLDPVVAALRSLGVDAQAHGRNDLVVGERKISGNAQAISGGRILHHGTLLLNADLDMVSRVLNVDTAKIESKGLKSVRSRVANINEFLEKPLSVDQLKSSLLEAFSHSNDFEAVVLSNADVASVRALAKDKYETWEWNYGKSPNFQFKNERRFPGGKVQVELDISKGLICACKIYGDFLALKPLDDLENIVNGTLYAYDDIKLALESMDLKMYMGSVSIDELLTCFGF